MKNKALTYLLVGILSLSLIGCGKKEETESVANVSEKEVVQEDINEPESDFIEDSEQEENIVEEAVEEISGINIKSQIVKDYLGGDYIEETEVINGVKYYVYPNGVVADIVEEDYYFFDNCEYNGKDIVLAIYDENQFCTNSVVIGNPDITLTTSESKNMTEIPDNIKYISSLDSNISGNLVIPDTVELFAPYGSIPANVESITISNNVTYFLGADFDYNMDTSTSFYPQVVFYKTYERDSKIKEVTIPDGVGILYHTFFGCTNLEKVTLPNTITEIGMGAFSDCVNMKEITIPEGVEIIGDGSFYRCTALTEIILPDSVTTISDSAFSFCENLVKVEIPSSIDDETLAYLQRSYEQKLPNLEIVRR